MAIDLFGPSVSDAHTTTVRPADNRSFGATDTWMVDCTSVIAADGTDITASLLNGFLAVFRGLARANGQTAGAVDIPALINSDADLLKKAVQHLIQRGLTNYPTSVGGTATAITLALSPVIAEYKAGLRIIFPAQSAATGASTVNVDGKGAVTLRKRGGAAIQSGDWATGDLLEIAHDGSVFHWVNQFPQAAAPPAESNDVHVADLTGVTQVDMADCAMMTRHLSMVRGGGLVSVNSAGGIQWNNVFLARGIGARFGLMGGNDYFPINFPADGTNIPTLPSGAITPSGGFIPLVAGEALYLILSVTNANSPGTLRSVRDGGAARVPAHWIPIAWRSHAGNEIGFCNGLTMLVPSVGVRSYNTTLFDAFRVPQAQDCERAIIAGTGILIDGAKGQYQWTGDHTISLESGGASGLGGIRTIAAWTATHPGNSNTGMALKCQVIPPPGGVNLGLWTVIFDTVQPDANYWLRGTSRLVSGDATSPVVSAFPMGQSAAFASFPYIDGYNEQTKANDAMTFRMETQGSYGITPTPVWFDIIRV